MFTTILLLAVLILGIGIDIYLALNKEQGDTFSERIQEWANGRFPSLTFFMAFLSGHFFTPFTHQVPFWVSLVCGLSMIIAIQVLRLFYDFPKWTIPVFDCYFLIRSCVWNDPFPFVIYQP